MTKPIKPIDNHANMTNPNKGQAGQNKQRSQAMGNRSKQLMKEGNKPNK